MLDATFATLDPDELDPDEDDSKKKKKWGVRLRGEPDEVQGKFGHTVTVRKQNGERVPVVLGRVLHPWDGHEVVYACNRPPRGYMRTYERLELDRAYQGPPGYVIDESGTYLVSVDEFGTYGDYLAGAP